MTSATTAARAGALVVSELFGPTLQGEGPSAGRLASFIRLSGCNLSCTWCDTPWTWRWSDHDRVAEQHPMRVPDVAAWALSHPAPLYVITGGEPLLQARALAVLVAELLATGARVEIETNGTLLPPASICGKGVTFNVSPKLGNAAMPLRRRIKAAALRFYAASGQAVFKFVVTRPSDLDEIAELERAHRLRPIWVMPEGTHSSAVLAGLQGLADEVVARGWNLTPRLHVLAWEDARGH
ncbi:7-carboxy-7-deazaguanine synthase QueE [Actinomadura sp. SCN-SB]|uniref:7-carboxy-7-deazaguanine synthase QueE n=1 Tax=Actinomadura sp. SCN-SB TaxID=3373092 RepID=UPI00374FE428